MVPPGPRPPGPELRCPKHGESDRRDEECASERRSDKPLGEAWLEARSLGMRGGGHWGQYG